MCEVVAKKMLTTVKTCKLYDKARTSFDRFAARSDCDGMWHYYDHVTKKYPGVDRGMREKGLKPLADVKAEMERLYREHLNNVRNPPAVC